MGFKTEQFVENVDENLKCSICLDVLEDPYQCKNGHSFCKGCITRCLETRQICPVCKKALRVKDLARCLGIKNMIEDLQVYCHPPESDGQTAVEDEESKLKCDWTGKLQSLAKHRETCPFQQVQCPNEGCNTNMQRRELEDHDKICEHKELKCDAKCGMTLIRRDLSDHKRNRCPEVRLACPKGCGTSIKRKDITTHRQTCPNEQVQCPNVGCDTNMQRRELEDHDKICKYKRVKCKKCGKALLRRRLPGHVDLECPEEMVLCHNRCTNPETRQINKMRRIHVQDHMTNDCPKTKVNCPYKEHGCGVKVERQDVDKHVQDNMAGHMMLLAKQCSTHTKQNSSLTEQCSTLTTKCSSLTEQCSTLTTKCSSLTEQCSALKQEIVSLSEENRRLKDEVKKRDDLLRTYIWNIKECRLYHSVGVNPPIIKLRSPTFWLCGYNWYLLLYPYGINKDNRGYVSAYLYKEPDNYGSSESSDASSSVQEIKTPAGGVFVTCRLSVMSQKPGFPDVSSQKSNVLRGSMYANCVIEWPKIMTSDEAVSEAYRVIHEKKMSLVEFFDWLLDPRGSLTIQCTIQLDKPQ